MKKIFEFIKQNIVYVLAFAAIVFGLTVILIPKPPPPPGPEPIVTFSPSPAGFPQTNAIRPQGGEKYQSLSDNDQNQLRKDELVGELIKKLPHRGTTFTFIYEISINQFLLSLPAGREESGNIEFDQFLKNNQIENRDWLKNLTIKSE